MSRPARAGGARAGGARALASHGPGARAGTSGPRPGRLYYGWVLVLTLGVTETVSYGILSYAFPVFLAPMEGELGWSRTAITGAFSLGTLVAGLAAISVGRLVDRHGARGVMTAGSVLAALLLAAWSGVQSLSAFYLLWIGLGIASAAVLYEPAFALVATWFQRRRGRALTVLTFLGGFASVVFVPLATGLVEAHGWRAALLRLAAILAVLTVVPHALLLRRRPADLGLLPDGASAGDAEPHLPSPASVPARAAVRSRSFALLATAFGLSSLVTTGLAVHLIPLLLERGFDAVFAGAVMGSVGLMALPGRLVLTPLGDHLPRAAVTAAIFALQAGGVAALLSVGGSAGVWAFVVLFGAGFGAVTPARAALVGDLYGPAHYGRIGGVMALWLALARAAAPVGASLLYVALGGYEGVLMTMLALSVAAGGAVLLAARGPASANRR